MNVLRTLGSGYLQSHRKASILKAGCGEGPCRLLCCASWGNESGHNVGMWPMVPGSHSATLGSLLQEYTLPGVGLGDPGSLAGMLRGLMVFPQCAPCMSLSLPFLATGVTWTTHSSSQLPTPSISSPSTASLLRNLPGPLIKVGRNMKAHPAVHQGLGQRWVPSILSHLHPHILSQSQPALIPSFS